MLALPQRAHVPATRWAGGSHSHSHSLQAAGRRGGGLGNSNSGSGSGSGGSSPNASLSKPRSDASSTQGWTGEGAFWPPGLRCVCALRVVQPASNAATPTPANERSLCLPCCRRGQSSLSPTATMQHSHPQTYARAAPTRCSRTGAHQHPTCRPCSSVLSIVEGKRLRCVPLCAQIWMLRIEGHLHFQVSWGAAGWALAVASEGCCTSQQPVGSPSTHPQPSLPFQLAGLHAGRGARRSPGCGSCARASIGLLLPPQPGPSSAASSVVMMGPALLVSGVWCSAKEEQIHPSREVPFLFVGCRCPFSLPAGPLNSSIGVLHVEPADHKRVAHGGA